MDIHTYIINGHIDIPRCIYPVESKDRKNGLQVAYWKE